MQEKWWEKAMGATATMIPYLNVVKLIIINDYYVSAAFVQLLLIEIVKNHTIFWTLFFRCCCSTKMSCSSTSTMCFPTYFDAYNPNVQSEDSLLIMY
jgi:hypothetical protein